MNFWVLLLVIMLMLLSSGSQLKEGELSPTENFSMNWTSLDSLSWNSSLSDDALARLNDSVVYPSSSLLVNKIIVKSLDWAGFVFTETAKWCVHYGFENPRPYLLYVYFVMFLVFEQPIVVTLAVLVLLIVWFYKLVSCSLRAK